MDGADVRFPVTPLGTSGLCVAPGTPIALSRPQAAGPQPAKPALEDAPEHADVDAGVLVGAELVHIATGADSSASFSCVHTAEDTLLAHVAVVDDASPAKHAPGGDVDPAHPSCVCPMRHMLLRVDDPGMYVCDLCGEDCGVHGVMVCRQCDYAMCSLCCIAVAASYNRLQLEGRIKESADVGRSQGLT